MEKLTETNGYVLITHVYRETVALDLRFTPRMDMLYTIPKKQCGKLGRIDEAASFLLAVHLGISPTLMLRIGL